MEFHDILYQFFPVGNFHQQMSSMYYLRMIVNLCTFFVAFRYLLTSFAIYRIIAHISPPWN